MPWTEWIESPKQYFKVITNSQDNVDDENL